MAQKWYQKASVQTTIVAGIIGIIIAGLNILHQRSELSKQNIEMREKNAELSNLVQEKTAEIQRLETQLTPFRTIAIEKYTGTESEALKQLAIHISEIYTSLSNTMKELDSTKLELMQKTSDRSLTEKQEQSLQSSLSSVSGKVIVQSDLFDSEARMYANQITTCLRRTGLEIVQNFSTQAFAIDAKGIVILVKDRDSVPPHAYDIQKALQSAGIDSHIGVSKSSQVIDDAIIIWVCHK